MGKTALLVLSLILLLVAPFQTEVRSDSQHDDRLTIKERAVVSSVVVFVNPDSAYTAIENIILNANSSVDIMAYEMWSQDFYNIISTIAQKDVRVRVLLENDTYGESGDYWNRNTSAMLYSLNRSGLPVWVRLETAGNFMHAKMIIVDDRIVIVGSENYMPTAFPPDPTSIELQPYQTPSRGWGAVITDATIALECRNIFESIFLNDSRSIDYTYSLGRGLEPNSNGVMSFSSKFDISEDRDVDVTLLETPGNSYTQIKSLIDRANHTIFIELPYINNTTAEVQALIDSLEQARSRGVTIQIILEDDFSGYGNYSTMAPYLESKGIHVVPAFSRKNILYLHNKGIIVDDEYVVVGSINWSGGGLKYNTEVGAIIRSRKLALFLKECFAYDWNLSSSNVFDSDGDGLSDYYENEHGTNPNDPDSDGDGVDDYSEVFIYGTDPTQPNSIGIEIMGPQNYTYLNTTDITIRWSIVNMEFTEAVELYINSTLSMVFPPDITQYTLSLRGEAFYDIALVPVPKITNLATFPSRVFFWIDNRPPDITIYSPMNHTEQNTTYLTLMANIHDYSPTTVEIWVNSILIKRYTNKKTYNITLGIVDLSPGYNTITIIATDSAINTIKQTIIVRISKQQNETQTTVTGASQTTEQIHTPRLEYLVLSSSVIMALTIVVAAAIASKKRGRTIAYM